MKGAFTFAPASGETNIAAYQYRLSGTDTWSAEQVGSTTSVAVTPEKAGLTTLYVRAKDNVGTGRYGAEMAVDFLVSAGDGPVGRWNFGEASGAALDSATADGADNATLGGGAARDDRGRRGLITRDSQGLPWRRRSLIRDCP